MVEIPDEWKFLEEGDKEWEPPPELRASPKGSMVNLVLQIVSSDLVGNETIEASGRLIASYAAFNAWIQGEGSRKLGFEGVARLAAEISFVTRDCYAAWVEFRTVFGPSRRVGVGEDERIALVLALQNGAIRLGELRDGETL
jgi:hypothetical protein